MTIEVDAGGGAVVVRMELDRALELLLALGAARVAGRAMELQDELFAALAKLLRGRHGEAPA
jgi:hypothetical protein